MAATMAAFLFVRSWPQGPNQYETQEVILGQYMVFFGC